MRATMLMMSSDPAGPVSTLKLSELTDVLHAQLLHFARQRIAAPAQQLGGILLEAIGLAQGHTNQYSLHFGQRLIQQSQRSRIQLLLRPMRELGHPVVIRGLAGGCAA